MILINLNKCRKAQSIIEFTLLFAVVAAGIIITHRYVYRSVNARLKRVQEEMTYNRYLKRVQEEMTYNR